MLEIQNVSKTFNAGTVNEKTALNGLNLKLNEGDFVTVIGGNGAGKSTMLNAVAGVWPVDEGKILIDGVDVTRLSEHQRAAYIGRVFQDPMMGTSLTIVHDGGAVSLYQGLAEEFPAPLKAGDTVTALGIQDGQTLRPAPEITNNLLKDAMDRETAVKQGGAPGIGASVFSIIFSLLLLAGGAILLVKNN